MATRTNIAERLSHVFARLEKAMDELPANSALILAWRKVLQPDDEDDINLLGNVGLISSALMKMRAQISASEVMKSSYKQSARATINQLKPLLAFSNMANPAIHVKGHCTAVQHGNLGLLGLALQAEFSEPRLEPADADELAKALKEVKELLSTSSVAIDLKHDLTMQIDQMLTWLSDLDIISSSDLYEKIGAATFTAKLIADADKEESPDSSGKKIFAKVGRIASGMIGFMGTASRFVDGASKLESSLHHLLASPPT